MKNYEKYAEEIREYRGSDFCDDFVKPCILKSSDCSEMDCIACRMLQMLWLLEDYEEPEVDWSEVKVDTPILVRDSERQEWGRRHFAKYEDGVVYAWVGGETNWTAEGYMSEWNYAKLAESEKGGAE